MAYECLCWIGFIQFCSAAKCLAGQGAWIILIATLHVLTEFILSEHAT